MWGCASCTEEDSEPDREAKREGRENGNGGSVKKGERESRVREKTKKTQDGVVRGAEMGAKGGMGRRGRVCEKKEKEGKLRRK